MQTIITKAQIIELYTDLAQNPHKDFTWEKGLKNALAHGYKQEWIDKIPSKAWAFCAAVGNPFNDAEIEKGHTVLDLGCGAGIDVLIASLLVGDNGKVYGLDITPKMLEIATSHAREMNTKNVKILQSSLDAIDLEDESVDVVISNGAINLTSCKESVFSEIYRVLKPNAKVFFADMINISESSSCDTVQEDWANCIAGTMKEHELIDLMQKSGFKDVACTGHTHYTTSQTTKGATFKATKIPPQELRKKHWDSLFQRLDYTQVLWHQPSPQKSLELIKEYSITDSNIIDVGCGASHLVDNLLESGYKNITLLDTSKTSLNIVESRVSSNNIRFECNDILDFKTTQKFDIWHDRAVFHFLLSQKERKKYFEVLSSSLKNGGIAIISTFRVDGPVHCAGLDIVQYNHSSMLLELTDGLELVTSEEYLHITHKKSEQKYIYFVLKHR